MSKKNRQRRRQSRRASASVAHSPFPMFVTRVGKQCIISTPMGHASPWTQKTYDLLHEYQDAVARTGGDKARESAGAAFVLIASDLLEQSMGPMASWEQLDIDAVARRAARDLPQPSVGDQCRANLRAFAQFLAETGRTSGQAA